MSVQLCDAAAFYPGKETGTKTGCVQMTAVKLLKNANFLSNIHAIFVKSTEFLLKCVLFTGSVGL